MFKQEILYFFPSKSYTSLSIFCKKREKERKRPFLRPLEKNTKKNTPSPLLFWVNHRISHWTQKYYSKKFVKLIKNRFHKKKLKHILLKKLDYNLIFLLKIPWNWFIYWPGFFKIFWSIVVFWNCLREWFASSCVQYCS